MVVPAEAALGDGLLMDVGEVVPPHAAATNVTAMAPATNSLDFTHLDTRLGYDDEAIRA